MKKILILLSICLFGGVAEGSFWSFFEKSAESIKSVFVAEKPEVVSLDSVGFGDAEFTSGIVPVAMICDQVDPKNSTSKSQVIIKLDSLGAEYSRMIMGVKSSGYWGAIEILASGDTVPEVVSGLVLSHSVFVMPDGVYTRYIIETDTSDWSLIKDPIDLAYSPTPYDELTCAGFKIQDKWWRFFGDDFDYFDEVIGGEYIFSVNIAEIGFVEFRVPAEKQAELFENMSRFAVALKHVAIERDVFYGRTG